MYISVYHKYLVVIAVTILPLSSLVLTPSLLSQPSTYVPTDDTLDPLPARWNYNDLFNAARSIVVKDQSLPDSIRFRILMTFEETLSQKKVTLPLLNFDMRLLAWCTSMGSTMQVTSDPSHPYIDTSFFDNALLWIRYCDSITQQNHWVIMGLARQRSFLHPGLDDWYLDRSLSNSIQSRGGHLPIASFLKPPQNSDLFRLLSEDGFDCHVFGDTQFPLSWNRFDEVIPWGGAVRKNTWRQLMDELPSWM